MRLAGIQLASELPGFELETERLRLRLYRADDFDDVFTMSSCPEMWTFSERGPMTTEESWARLLRHRGHWAVAGYGIFAVQEKETGTYVGEAGFADFRRNLGGDFDPHPEASWSVVAPMQGRGYATEAMAAALRWLRAAQIRQESVCLVHEENAASLRVAEKLGFRHLREVRYRGYPAVLMSTQVPVPALS